MARDAGVGHTLHDPLVCQAADLGEVALEARRRFVDLALQAPLRLLNASAVVLELHQAQVQPLLEEDYLTTL